MPQSPTEQLRLIVDDLYRADSRRIFATLVRLVGDFDLAEEALHDAFAAALVDWQRDGLPANPRAWLISAGRFKAIDTIRRRERFDASLPDLVRRVDGLASVNSGKDALEVEDDRLRLIFTCCHPALAPATQVALTLREVCDLATEEIAAAFLVAPTAMAQRIVRGKAKIRDARIPYQVPAGADLPERLDSVLSVIYLVFNEGYSASSGNELTRPALSAEAIRLGRLLMEMLQDPEVMGLLALMLLQESRRPARTSAGGDLILLEEQDRTLWNGEQIAEGTALVGARSPRNLSAPTPFKRPSPPSMRPPPPRPPPIGPRLSAGTICCAGDPVTHRGSQPRRGRRHARWSSARAGADRCRPRRRCLGRLSSRPCRTR